MKCKTASQLMMDYMNDLLDEEGAIALSKHLRTCESCKEEFMMLSSIMKQVDTMEIVPAPKEFEQRVMKAIEHVSLEGKQPIITTKEWVWASIWGLFSFLFGIGVILIMYKERIMDTVKVNAQIEGYLERIIPVSDVLEQYIQEVIDYIKIMVPRIQHIAPILFGTMLIVIGIVSMIYAQKSRKKAGVR